MNVDHQIQWLKQNNNAIQWELDIKNMSYWDCEGVLTHSNNGASFIKTNKQRKTLLSIIFRATGSSLEFFIAYVGEIKRLRIGKYTQLDWAGMGTAGCFSINRTAHYNPPQAALLGLSNRWPVWNCTFWFLFFGFCGLGRLTVSCPALVINT